MRLNRAVQRKAVEPLKRTTECALGEVEEMLQDVGPSREGVTIRNFCAVKANRGLSPKTSAEPIL